jgi:hypothetical protein
LHLDQEPQLSKLKEMRKVLKNAEIDVGSAPVALLVHEGALEEQMVLKLRKN